MQPAPIINKASKRLQRSVSSMLEWQQQRDRKLEAARQAKEDRETTELERAKPTITRAGRGMQRSVSSMLEWQARRTAKLEAARKAKEEQEAQHLQPAPKISSRSAALVERRRARQGGGADADVANRLYAVGQEYEQRRKEKSAALRAVHTHKPKLSAHSANYHRPGDAGERLHALSKQRTDRRERAAKVKAVREAHFDAGGRTLFKPKINKRSAAIARKRLGGKRVEDRLSERGAVYEARRQRRLVQEEAEAAALAEGKSPTTAAAAAAAAAASASRTTGAGSVPFPSPTSPPSPILSPTSDAVDSGGGGGGGGYVPPGGRRRLPDRPLPPPIGLAPAPKHRARASRRLRRASSPVRTPPAAATVDMDDAAASRRPASSPSSAFVSSAMEQATRFLATERQQAARAPAPPPPPPSRAPPNASNPDAWLQAAGQDFLAKWKRGGTSSSSSLL